MNQPSVTCKRLKPELRGDDMDWDAGNPVLNTLRLFFMTESQRASQRMLNNAVVTRQDRSTALRCRDLALTTVSLLGLPCRPMT